MAVMKDMTTKYIAIVPARNPRPPRKRKEYDHNLKSSTGRLSFQAIAFDPPNLSIIEGSPDGTFVAEVKTGVFSYALQLLDNAQGRFKLVGQQILAGSVSCDYELATHHTIIVRVGSGVDQLDVSAIVQVIDIDDGDQDDSHRLTDQNDDPILDQNNNFILD